MGKKQNSMRTGGLTHHLADCFHIFLALTLGTNSIDTLRQADRRYAKVLSYNTAESALGAAGRPGTMKNDATWLSSASNVITLDPPERLLVAQQLDFTLFGTDTD